MHLIHGPQKKQTVICFIFRAHYFISFSLVLKFLHLADILLSQHYEFL